MAVELEVLRQRRDDALAWLDERRSRIAEPDLTTPAGQLSPDQIGYWNALGRIHHAHVRLKEAQERGEVAKPRDGAAFRDLVGDGDKLPATLPDDEVDDDGPELVSAASLEAPADADRHHVRGLIRPGAIHVFASIEGLIKTHGSFELATRGVTGTGSVFGRYPVEEPFRVAIVDEENGEAQLWRVEEAIREDLGLERDALTGLTRVSFAGMHLGRPDRQEWLLGELRRLAEAGELPELIILDTGGVMVDDEWGAPLKDAIRFLRRVIREFGCAFLILIHMTKPSRGGKDGDRVHGTALSDVMGQWTRHADVVITALDLGAGRVRLSVRKRIEQSSVILARSGALWSYVAEAEADEDRESSDGRILRAVEAGAGTAEEVRNGLGMDGKPMPRRTFYDALRRLRNRGFVADGTPLRLTPAGFEAVS